MHNIMNVSDKKNLPTKNILEREEFIGEYYQTFKEELISILHKFIQKTEEDTSQLIL